MPEETIENGIMDIVGPKKWIGESALKRHSNSSSVIVYETSDPMRSKEWLRLYPTLGFRMLFAESKIQFEGYHYDAWDGLSRINVAEEGKLSFTPVTSGGGRGDPFSTGMAAQPIRDLSSALRHVDAMLRTKSTVFVIRNVAEQTRELQLACRTWATISDLYNQKSSVFIFTDNVNSIFDSYTKSLVVVVNVPTSIAEERETIINDIATSKNLPKADAQLIKGTSGLRLYDVETALLESWLRFKAFDIRFISKFRAELAAKMGIRMREPRWGFNFVGGYERTKKFIGDEIISLLTEPERAEKLGITELPRGILLFGPPGTGKSLLAEATGHELKLPFVEFSMSDILSKYVGESEQKARQFVTLIEDMAPCLVFVDEVDRLGVRTAGETGDSGVRREVFSTLLSWLGDRQRKSIVIAATNRPEFLDDAFMRTGRFDRKIPILYPDAKAREQILEVHLKVQRKVPIAGNIDFKELTQKTNYYSGADLEELVKRSQRKAFKRKAAKVTQEDFENAFKTFRIDTEQRMAQVNQYLDLAVRYCDDMTFLQELRGEVMAIASRAETVSV